VNFELDDNECGGKGEWEVMVAVRWVRGYGVCS